MSLIKPSDAIAWSSCIRRAWLDNKGGFTVAPEEDAFAQLIKQFGDEHELLVLQRLRNQWDVHVASSPEDTRQLMAKGVRVIYQAQLFDEKNGLIGYPDFLIRHESGEYQAADAKLSLSENKKEIQIQLGFYRRLLGNSLPAIVFLGNGSEAIIGDEADSVTDQFISGMSELLASDIEPEVRYSHSKCRICVYTAHCKPEFDKKEELSLLYGIQGRAAEGLEGDGIKTITQLSATDPAKIPDIPYLKCEKKKRAVLQAKSWLSGEIFQINPVSLPEGDWIHFDIEDNPLTGTGEKHVYLWGFLLPSNDYDYFDFIWTNDDSEDKNGWLQFLAKIEYYKRRYPSLILAHYSAHERSTIKSYAKRYNMEDNATVIYLLGENSPLFDIQQPVLESFVLPLQGYGLKDVCKHRDLVDFQWEDEDSSSQWSVVQFNRFLAESEQQIKKKLKADILRYNRDDVMATRQLEQWLRFVAHRFPVE